jgi:hypothetical protein
MPANRMLNQRIKQSLYSLKREYGGGPLSIYKLGSTTTDLETGVKTVNKEVTVIQKAIILPAKVSRDVVQTISQISANKAFVYGGSYDSRTRTFIIDRLDCPDLASLGEDDWIVFDGRKYEIKTIQEFEFDTAWVIVARHQLGDVGEQIYPLGADHLLSLSQTATYTL